jgi:uncharacterized protein YyaL (SSP411 family)
MEEESFSNTEIQEFLQKFFICVRIDREERPDLDQLYRRAVKAMTGQEGWPVNVFLTPELRPFYGGTYFSFESRYKKPSFRALLEKVKKVYFEDSAEVQKSADSLTNFLFQSGRYFESKSLQSQNLYSKVLANLEKLHDQDFGGFGGSPKFFHTEAFELFILASAVSGENFYSKAVSDGLLKILSSGVFDHVEGGFFRFASDREWQKPHPEKSLCDSVLMARVLLSAFGIEKNELFRAAAKKTLDFVSSKFRSPEGLFWSSEYSDQIDRAAHFYFFSSQELVQTFSNEEQEDFKEHFRLAGEPGALCWRAPANLESWSSRASLWQRLKDLRLQREPLLLNRKIQTSWNALSISSFIEFSKVTGDQAYWAIAEKALQALLDRFKDVDYIPHVQEVSSLGFLEDQVFWGQALLDAYEQSGDKMYLDSAESVGRMILSQFYDPKAGGFWSTPEGQKDLLVRTKELHDSAMPSSFTHAILFFLKLHRATSETCFQEAAMRSVESVLGTAEEEPGGFSSLARVLYWLTQSEPA